jgi:hypothetical protein
VSASLGPTLPGLAKNTSSQLSHISLLFLHAVGHPAGSLGGGYDRIAGHPVMSGACLMAEDGRQPLPRNWLCWQVPSSPPMAEAPWTSAEHPARWASRVAGAVHERLALLRRRAFLSPHRCSGHAGGRRHCAPTTLALLQYQAAFGCGA